MKRGFLNKQPKASIAARPAPTTSTKGPSATAMAKAPWLRDGVTKPVELPSDFKVPENPVAHCPAPSSYAGQIYTPTTLPAKGAPGGHTECLLPASLRTAILSLPGFPRPMQRPPKMYDIVDLPGRGKGLVASRLIKAGTLIIDERPFLVSPAGISQDAREMPRHFTAEQSKQVALLYNERWIEMLFKRLDSDRQEAYMALCNSHQHDGSGPLFGRLRTNRWGTAAILKPPSGQRENVYDEFSCVCDTLSRINHSCAPNALQDWRTTSFSMHLTAVRDIQPGEEITATYVGLDDLYTDRTDQLRPYGITCNCPLCQNPTESDERRRRITLLRAIVAQFPWWQHVPRGAQLDLMICSSVELMRNIELEGLQGDADVYVSAALNAYNAYLAVGDLQTAFRYTKELVVAAKLSKASKKELRSFEVISDMRLLAVQPHFGRGKHWARQVQEMLKGHDVKGNEVLLASSKLDVLD